MEEEKYVIPSSLAVEVFCSYAHEDEDYCKQLKTHVSVLKRQGLISLWYDQQILPGSYRERAIDAHLETASIIVLLVSSDFIASDYCYDREMKRALARHEVNEARVIPIVVRPCEWQSLPLGSLQVLPSDGKPISMWASIDEAWVQVAAGLRHVVEDLLLLTATAPRSSLPPIWMIPYPRNPFFLERDELLSQIHTQLHAGHPTALAQPQAISGLGGIGKTQIGVNPFYRFMHTFDESL
jgi:TIR domain